METVQGWQAIASGSAADAAKIGRLEELVESLRADVEMARRQRDYWEVEATDRGARHRADVERIGERLLAEANDRGWCAEFDTIVDEINGDLYVELPVRERDFEVRVDVTLTISVSARNAEAAEEKAAEIAQHCERWLDRQDGVISNVSDYFEVEEDA